MWPASIWFWLKGIAQFYLLTTLSASVMSAGQLYLSLQLVTSELLVCWGSLAFTMLAFTML
jgi:hypothetical protein